MTQRLRGFGRMAAVVIAVGCSSPGPTPITPPPPPPEDVADAVVPETTEVEVEPLDAAPPEEPAETGTPDATEEASVVVSTAPPTEPCGTWVALDEQLYRRVTFAFLTAEPEHPGRVVVRAYVSDLYRCGPCPHGFHCEPCGSRNILRPYAGAADEESYFTFGGEEAGRCVDAYVRLGPRYSGYGGTSHDSDPRASEVWLEAALPIDDSLCTAESSAAEAEAAGVPETCLAEFAPGTMYAREGDVPLPMPETLDLAERLRRAEVSFAAERWDEARTAYFRLARDMMREEDMFVWAYAQRRTAQCDLALGEPLPAIERLTSALGVRARRAEPVPGLREALVAELGRACAATVQDAAQAESFLAGQLEGEELLAALEAAEKAWTAAGRETDARAMRSILQQRRAATGDGGDG